MFDDDEEEMNGGHGLTVIMTVVVSTVQKKSEKERCNRGKEREGRIKEKLIDNSKVHFLEPTQKISRRKKE